jgi:predicted anti-sigma-YlaC factor YlaD
MLKCKDVAEQGSDYIDGEKSLPERLSWRLHLFMCSNCRRFIKQLKLTRAMVASKDLPEASDKEVQKVMAYIAKNDDKPEKD